GRAVLDHEILSLDVAVRANALAKRVHIGCVLRLRDRLQETDAPDSALLCVRRNRPRDRRAADERDERAAIHSITSSAVASSVGDTVRPSILAVWRLITSSNLVACTTGRSAGLAPLSTRPV